MSWRCWPRTSAAVTKAAELLPRRRRKGLCEAGEASPAAYEAAENLLPGERIVQIKPQVILDAADRLRARG